MNLRMVISAASCVAVLAMVGCTGKSDKPADSKVAPVPITGVTVVTIAEEAVPELLEVVGTVKARHSAVISSRVPGTLTELRVREGDRVKKGQLIGLIESQENAAGAAGAQAAMEEARRGVEEAQSRKIMADVTFERFQKLFDEQAVTRQEFDMKQTERNVASHVVARAESRLKQAQEALRSASTVAGYGRLTSPTTGIVTGRNVDPGTTVYPAQPLLTVEEEGGYLLELAAPESLLGKIKPGISIQVSFGSGTYVEGKIAEIVPTVDPASRTFIAKVNLPDKGFRSGMYGRAQLAAGMTRGILVPRQSIREQGNLTSVWVVDKDGICRMRLVKIGKLVGERVEVLAGLSGGERIITAGSEKVVEGAQIR